MRLTPELKSKIDALRDKFWSYFYGYDFAGSLICEYEEIAYEKPEVIMCKIEWKADHED